MHVYDVIRCLHMTRFALGAIDASVNRVCDQVVLCNHSALPSSHCPNHGGRERPDLVDGGLPVRSDAGAVPGVVPDWAVEVRIRVPLEVWQGAAVRPEGG